MSSKPTSVPVTTAKQQIKTHDDLDFKRYLKYFVLAGVAPLLLGWISIGLFLIGHFWLTIVPLPVNTLQAAGQLGDAFGFVNAIVSALAFCAVAVTLRFQTIEIQAQRENADQDRADQFRTVYLAALIGWRDSNVVLENDGKVQGLQKIVNRSVAERQIDAVMKDCAKTAKAMFPNVDVGYQPKETYAENLVDCIARMEEVYHTLKIHSGGPIPTQQLIRIMTAVHKAVKSIKDQLQLSFSVADSTLVKLNYAIIGIERSTVIFETFSEDEHSSHIQFNFSNESKRVVDLLEEVILDIVRKTPGQDVNEGPHSPE